MKYQMQPMISLIMLQTDKRTTSPKKCTKAKTKCFPQTLSLTMDWKIIFQNGHW